MIDAQGELSNSDSEKRLEAIENHKKWIDFAKQLGCGTLRLNLYGESDLENGLKILLNLYLPLVIMINQLILLWKIMEAFHLTENTCQM